MQPQQPKGNPAPQTPDRIDWSIELEPVQPGQPAQAQAPAGQGPTAPDNAPAPAEGEGGDPPEKPEKEEDPEKEKTGTPDETAPAAPDGEGQPAPAGEASGAPDETAPGAPGGEGQPAPADKTSGAPAETAPGTPGGEGQPAPADKTSGAPAAGRHWPAVVGIAALAVLVIAAAMTPAYRAAQAAAQARRVPVATAAPTPTPTPTPDPQELARQRIEGVLATMQDNCTGDRPQVKDPAGWDEAGRALMEKLEKDPYYAQLGFAADGDAAQAGALATVEAERQAQQKRDIPGWAKASPEWEDAILATELAAQEEYPYLLAVNRAASTVTVYARDGDGRYTKPYMAMVCSGGSDTPTGWYSTPIRYNWRLLSGPCYGQYATRIWDGYLFHSVPYYSEHKDDLEYDQFNELGTPASLGCIRLAVVDVKWIFDNCPLGTPVVIYDDADDPGPMGKPGTIRIDPKDEALRGWDPTDPDPLNPWPADFRIGTAIRSADALAQYEQAVGEGIWNDTLNPADLQGYSTDSSIEGTRG